ncbi:MAG: tRNA (N6-threonylcarbamoyladenosine(37)-N6)-methyltransferase TrmO [Lachnospiraceae bacterium]|nr:tRNA (N6-threonylcarbamoyladenosine(37)-N6)-methyltransferase TrmO [Lachnospiraceae bacterium]
MWYNEDKKNFEVRRMKIIAKIHTDFPEKFGIPRQSGLVNEVKGRIIFEPEFRNPEIIKGLEDFNYIWLLWQFDDGKRKNWSATVKPPRLGGNVRKGVFATRSPFRPNPIGLSSVKLERIELTEEGPVLIVAGADLRDQTPIYDIKPYLPYVDIHEDAVDGFAGEVKEYRLIVKVTDEAEKQLEKVYSKEQQETIKKLLEQDPRPSYHNDPTRVYGMAYAGWDIHFCVKGEILTILEVTRYNK